MSPEQLFLWLVATTFGRTPGSFGSLADVSLIFRQATQGRPLSSLGAFVL